MKQIIFILIAFVILSSCQKNDFEVINETLPEAKLKSITPDQFDWEKADYMPTPPGTIILSPFASGVNTCYPNLYLNDLKKSDGWELAYNSFSTSGLRDPLFFGLYNRYRGILRVFFYVPARAPRPSTFLSHSVSIYNGSTSLLNFTDAANGIKTSNNIAIATTIQPYQLNATGSWCAAEFEMCYDPNTPNISNDTRMQWHLKSVNISEMKINGESQGTITGSITQQTSPPNMFNTFASGMLALQGLNALKDIKLSENLKKPIQKGLESSLSGVAKNVFSIISGGSSTTTYINMKTQANYNLTGLTTEIDPIASPSMVISGCKDQSSVIGVDANYKVPMGVLGIIGSPKVKGTYYRERKRYRDRYDKRLYAWVKDPRDFYLDKSSYKIIFNPSIINSSSTGATIANYREEIIGLPPYGERSRSNWGDAVEEINRIEPARFVGETGSVLRTKNIYIKNVDDHLVQAEERIRNGGPRTAVHWYKKGDIMIDEYLRISFDVIPNNGAPKCKIVKTFNLYFDGSTVTL